MLIVPTPVRNCPIDHSRIRRFIVARPCEQELWHWGSYDSKQEAVSVASDVDGIVLDTEAFL